MCYYIYNKVSYSNFLDTGPSLVDSLAEMVMGRGSVDSQCCRQSKAGGVDSSVSQN